MLTDGKDKSKAKVLIEWSGELRSTVKGALATKRNKDAGTILLFGNMTGQRYTMGGRKSILHDPMTQCGAAAAKRRIEFRKRRPEHPGRDRSPRRNDDQPDLRSTKTRACQTGSLIPNFADFGICCIPK